jgi:S1-C subfamily serine protease
MQGRRQLITSALGVGQMVNEGH